LLFIHNLISKAVCSGRTYFCLQLCFFGKKEKEHSKNLSQMKAHFKNESSSRNPIWKWKHPFESENCLPDFFLNYRGGIYWVRLYKNVMADWFLSASSWIFLSKNTTQESLCNLKSCCYVNSGFMLESLGTLCNIIQQALGLSSCSLI